jgi:hypothetical protein
MKTFLIQTIDREIRHDFSFTLLEAIRYQNWRGNDMRYILSNCFINNENLIPIGSVEFVCEYLKTVYNKEPKPKNVPEELFKWSNRKIFNGTEKDLTKRLFVKSNDKIKEFADIVEPDFKLKKGNYQFSEVINIESEWRCFVYKNELIGLQNYSGDFLKFPDVNKIKNIIKDYESCPIAYTLDIGLENSSLFVIEVHDFFSCGFYGFVDLNKIPYMFSRWFNEYLQTI